MKKKILWVGDLSETNSGYANYTRNILELLHRTGKYEITELGCFGSSGMVVNSSLPWQIYSNLWTHEEEKPYYDSHFQNKFGAYKFNDVCCLVKPDVVLDIRDWHMLSFEGRSPLRQYFSWIIMPPIDSIPQPPTLIETYKSADTLLQYTQWGRKVLEDDYGLTVFGVAPPAANYNYYKPLDQGKCREFLGIAKKDNIVLTVMRNQRRKQYPELFEAFADFVKDKDESYKLYIHCQYPDAGWDIPSLLLKNKILNRVLITYYCNSCHRCYADLFKDAKTYCKYCKSYNSMNPGSSAGVSDEMMSLIYNSADAYVQYSSCEGFGMPIVEASACGIHTFGVNYSATPEVVKNCLGTIIEPRSLFYSDGEEFLKSIPNNKHLIDELNKYFINKYLHISKKIIIHNATKKVYDYNESVKIWEKAIDLSSYGKWNSPKIQEESILVDKNQDIQTFVRNSIIYTARRYDLVGSLWEQEYIQSLNFGVTSSSKDVYGNDMSSLYEKRDKEVYTKQDFVNLCQQMYRDKMFWENKR